MRGNTITIRLGQGRVGQTGNLFQYDLGQRLIIEGVDLPAAWQAHFSNAALGRSKPMIGTGNEVDIPDEYLTSGQDVHVWVYVTGEDHAETEYHGIIHVTRRAEPTDIEPTPAQRTVIDTLVDELNDALEEAQDLAEDIPEDIEAALAAAKESGEFDGEDGVSPVVRVTDITGGHRIEITDAQGTRTFDVMNGAKGDPGEDGFSPSASVSKTGKVTTLTVTDKSGTTTAEILDGEDGSGADIIDDTAGIGDTDKTWSANKSASELSTLNFALNGKQDAPATAGTAGQVLGLDANLDPVWSDINPVETVSGTTPSITGKAGVRYVCGEVATLTIVVPASGIIDVVFDSGSTPTVLTVTPPTGMTMKWANGFDPTALEANTTYEINILDGCMGVAGSWT